MSAATTGIHHVTAIAGDLRRNVDFYRECWAFGWLRGPSPSTT